MHDDVARLHAALEITEREALALAASLSSGQFTWQPGGGRAWSVAHCLVHLTVATRIYLEAMTTAAEAARITGSRRRHPIAPGWFARWFIREMEPPPKRRLKAPGKIVPAPSGTKEEIGRRFADSQVLARTKLVEWADLDLNRVRFVNPFLPLLRYQLGAGFLIMAAHNRRHIWQAQRVTESPDFPRTLGATLVDLSVVGQRPLRRDPWNLTAGHASYSV